MALLWRESHSEDKGRILVASRPIPRGAAVLEDWCLVAAPDTPTAPLCVVCLGPLARGGAACRDRAEMASHMPPQRHRRHRGFRLQIYLNELQETKNTHKMS